MEPSEPDSAAKPTSGKEDSTADDAREAPDILHLQGRLPDYEIIGLIGRGGMGAVYKARQKSLWRLVAIKVLPPELTEDELRFSDRFQNEAETMANLSHPGIVAVHDFGDAGDGLPYFVMEFVNGTDVSKRIEQEGALPVDEAQRIMRAVCDALDYAHRHGVIHRDIKPANILIDSEGRVKVGDFGLARISGHSQQSGLTRTNVAMGTQEFAAPEMLTPGAPVDHRADVYSAGVMLYQLLTGTVPRVMFKLPSRCRPELGTRFDALVCKALETDPADRYQTAAELRESIESAARSGASKPPPITSSGKQHYPKATLISASLAACFVLILCGWFLLSHRHGHASLPHTASSSSADKLERGAIRLWDAPDKLEKRPQVTWENNAMRLEKTLVENGGPVMRDAVLRALVRMNHDGISQAISLRGSRDTRYTAGLSMGRKVVMLEVFQDPRRTVIREWPFPRSYSDDEWVPLEIRVVGDAISVSFDGDEFETVHDSTITESGRAQAYAEKAGFFRDVVLVPLDRSASAPITSTFIDLLPLVDVKRDAIDSEWSVTPEGAVRSARVRDKTAGRLEFPYAPPAEYDFEIEFTVEEGESGHVMQLLAVPGHWLEWSLLPPPAFGPEFDGLANNAKGRTEGVGRLNRLRPGDRHRSVVEVRSNSLRALVDGEEIARYSGDFKRLSDQYRFFKLRDTTHIGVGIFDGIALLIHKATVREISGAGTLDKPAAQPAARVVDLLPLVDVKRDAIGSEWSLAPEGGLRSKPGKAAGRLEFPYAPPAEYDFEIEFTVEEGQAGHVSQVIAVPGHWFMWTMLPPPAFGPDLDGIKPGAKGRAEGVGSLFGLKPGDRHRSMVEVRKDSLRALVDGKEIVRYTGDFKRLSDPYGFFKLHDTKHIGVGVYMEIALLIHKATVREISGAGKVEAAEIGASPSAVRK